MTLGVTADRMRVFSKDVFRGFVLRGIASIVGLVLGRSLLNMPASTLPMENQVPPDTSQKFLRNL